MKSKISPMALLICFTFVLTCWVIPSAYSEGKSTSASGKHLKIGVTVPLSGNVAKYGVSIKNGILLAQQTYDKHKVVEFFFEDDGFLPKNTVTAVKKFIGQEKVDGLLIFGSGPSLAAAPIAEQNKIPMVAFATAPEIVKDRKYVMRHFASVIKETSVLVEEVRRKKYNSVAVVATAQDAMLSLRDEFLKRISVEIVSNDEVLPGDTELRSLAVRIASVRPQAVYLLLMPGQVGIFSRQLRENGYKGDLFGAHQLEDPREVAASQGALVGAWFVSVNAVRDPTFESRYENSFGLKPGNVACNSYDTAKIIIESATSTSLISYLRTLKNFKGAMGTYGALPDGSFDVPVLLKRVTASGFEIIP
jgi:branched-chain amino acid transport system substrate-binding protein